MKKVNGFLLLILMALLWAEASVAVPRGHRSKLRKARVKRQLAYVENPFTSEIKDFETDICSMSPDGTPVTPDAWSHCCVTHDYSYWQGGPAPLRLSADNKFKTCIEKAGYPNIAAIYYKTVRMAGEPNTHQSFRWGYGWNYGIGYDKLTEAQLYSVKVKLAEHFAREKIRKNAEKIETEKSLPSKELCDESFDDFCP